MKYDDSSEDDDNDDNYDHVKENEECSAVMDLLTDNMQTFNDIGIYDFEISDESDYSKGTSQSEVYGFKLVADNLDKNFRPRLCIIKQYLCTIFMHMQLPIM